MAIAMGRSKPVPDLLKVARREINRDMADGIAKTAAANGAFHSISGFPDGSLG